MCGFLTVIYNAKGVMVCNHFKTEDELNGYLVMNGKFEEVILVDDISDLKEKTKSNFDKLVIFVSHVKSAKIKKVTYVSKYIVTT